MMEISFELLDENGNELTDEKAKGVLSALDIELSNLQDELVVPVQIGAIYVNSRRWNNS